MAVARDFPLRGDGRKQIDADLRALVARDRQATAGIGFARRFYAGGDVAEIAAGAYGLFAHAGRASPYPGLPSLASMVEIQRDLESWMLELLGAPQGANAILTSGGTESVILALRAALLAARRSLPANGPLEIVATYAAHPCLDKAAELMGIRLVRVPVGPDFCADLSRLTAAIGPRTIMLYASFPSYAYGLDDDVAALGALAAEHGLWLHVDACMSGLLAPFMRLNGDETPAFDLSVRGVSSVSADLHKHGYSAKGASALLLRGGPTPDFVYGDHPLPPMATATLAGTAPGAPLASAWATMRFLGVDGYCALARQLSETRAAFIAAIRAVPGFDILGDPRFSIVVVTSNRHDMSRIHAEMAARRWFTLATHTPPGLHLNLGALDAELADQFAADLASAGEAA